MNSKGIFITGTDTGTGKTWATQALMYALRSRGLNVSGMKPVASGGMDGEHSLKNKDALLIQAQCTTEQPYAWINPYIFKEPIAPHIAAQKSGITIDLGTIVKAYNNIADRSDFIVVEGIGGWRVPLSERLSTVDMVRALNLPVLLVIGMRLGCINHALLTAECIRADNIMLAGLVANEVDANYTNQEYTLQTLNRTIQAPFLGTLPYLHSCDIAMLAANLDVTPLLNQDRL
jgi:dethiobiotin synthetase